jgi:hypothetical protein
MDAMPAVRDKLLNLRQQMGSSLTTVDQQLMFNQQTRYQQFRLLGEIGRHYDQQAQSWAQTVNKNSVDNAVQSITARPDDDANFNDQVEKAINAEMKILENSGLGGSVEARVHAMNDARGRADAARVEGWLGSNNPAAAKAYLQQNRDAIAGPLFDTLWRRATAGDDKAETAAILDRMFGGAIAGTVPRGSGAAPLPPEQYKPLIKKAADQYGVPEELLTRMLSAENGFKPTGVSSAGARGIAQFLPSTAREYGIDPDDPTQAIPGAAHYLADLKAKTGTWNGAVRGYLGGDPHKDASYTRNGVPQLIDILDHGGSPTAAATGGGGEMEVWGDSLGVGLQSHLKTEGHVHGGDTPQAIFDNIKAQPADYWQGKTIVLPSGTNGNQMPAVEDTIKYLKDNGANVIAVGYGPKFPEKNAELTAIAGRQKVPVIAAEGVGAAEGVHPGPQGYAAMAQKIRAAGVSNPQVQPIPPAQPQSPMTAPVPGMPTREEIIQRIPEGLSPEQYNRVYSGAMQRYSRQMQATSADRATALQQYKGGLAMLQDGRDFQYDPNTYHRLFPTDQANEMLGNLQDAQTIGQQITAVRNMSLSDIVSQRVANQTVLSHSTGVDYEQQRKRAIAFDRAAEVHIKALGEDPAAYVTTNNPEILSAQQAIGTQSAQDSATLRGAGQPDAVESFAGKLLAEQERLGIPADARHVLTNRQSQATMQQITSNPEQAPAALQEMQQRWGTAWPEVWRDLVTVGKMPAAYQMVGALDNQGDGALLARALGHANKEGVNRDLSELIDKGATGVTKPSQAIRTRIEGSEDIQKYARSMLASGASIAQVNGIVSSIDLLAQAKALYHGEDAGAAADHAIESAIGKYEFMPNGGARIPRANADAITAAARDYVSSLTFNDVQQPSSYTAGAPVPGAATGQDWFRVLQASPNWLTVGQAIRLMDQQGRFVKRADGNFIEVPFNAVAPTAAPLSPIPTPVY